MEEGSNQDEVEVRIEGLVYLAGPMTRRVEYNKTEFNRAAKAIVELVPELHVVTPFSANNIVWQLREGRDFIPATDACEYGDEAMREILFEDFRILFRASRIFLMHDWYLSRGATIEAIIAGALGIPLYILTEDLLGYVGPFSTVTLGAITINND